MGLRDFSIYDMAQRNAVHYPTMQAVVDGQRRISYSEFLSLVDRLSAGLKEQGANFQDRIGIMAYNSLEFFTLYFVASKIGAVVVPINYRLSVSEVEYILKDTTPKLLFVDENCRKIANSFINRMPFIEGFFNFDGEEGPFRSLESLLESKPDREENDVSSEDAFVIIHTAAVEGKPRGAILSQGNVLASGIGVQSKIGFNEQDVYLHLIPLFHAAGFLLSMGMFHAAGTNLMMPRFDPGLAVKLIEKEKVTIIFDFPPILARILDSLEVSSTDVSSLRYVVGLELLETVNRLHHQTKAEFFSGYGQTETSSFVVADRFCEQEGYVGRPNFMTRVKVVDDYGREVDKGTPGEILIRGPQVFKGYWNLDEETAYTFREGWHHTGDIGRLDDEGCLFYVGRKEEKELIKPGGENVYPWEVEKVILEHPKIEEVVVIGVPDPQWGEAIKAVCVSKQGESVDEAELIEFVAARIARHKKPKHTIFVSCLPKNEDGIIDRELVKAEYGKA